MFQNIIESISTVPEIYVLLIIFFFSYIENLFPPSPSDVAVILGATIVVKSVYSFSFVSVLLITTAGSALGFMTMYFLGHWFGDHILRTGKLKFITPEALEKSDIWFKKYGYWLIIANRFLPGTRAIISFFAGLSDLNTLKCLITATLSAAVWNTFIILIGFQIGSNINNIDSFFTNYSKIALTITIIFGTVFAVRYYINKNKPKKS